MHLFWFVWPICSRICYFLWSILNIDPVWHTHAWTHAHTLKRKKKGKKEREAFYYFNLNEAEKIFLDESVFVALSWSWDPIRNYWRVLKSTVSHSSFFFFYQIDEKKSIHKEAYFFRINFVIYFSKWSSHSEWVNQKVKRQKSKGWCTKEIRILNLKKIKYSVNFCIYLTSFYMIWWLKIKPVIAFNILCEETISMRLYDDISNTL